MSISLNHLNKPGMATSFKSGGGISRKAVANNLANPSSNSIALRSGSRTNWVGGTNESKGIGKYNYQGIRQRANSGVQMRSFGLDALGGMTSAKSSTNVQVNESSFATGQAVFQMGLGVFNQLNQMGVFGGKSEKSQGAASKLEGALGSLSSSGSANISGVMSQMSGATTSADLRQAISGAETQLSSLAYVKSEQTATQVTKLESEVSSLDTEVKGLETKVKEDRTAVSTAENSVKTLTTTRDAKKSALSNAMTKKNQCSTAFAEAHANTVAAETSLASARANLAATSETLPGGTPNPAYAAAKNAVETAEHRVEEAKRKEEAAKTDLDRANEASLKADNEVKTAEADLQNEQNKLDGAEAKLKEAEENLKKSETELADKKAELTTKKGELEKIQSDTKDYEALEAEITKQKGRLTKLEEEERNEFNNLSTKIDEKGSEIDARAAKIDVSDGLSLAERLRQAKNNRAQARMETLTDKKASLQDNVAKTNILRDNTNVLTGKNGAELRSGDLPSGGKVYFIGTREVTQAEFEAAKSQ